MNEQEMLMDEEMQRVNRQVSDCFKHCILSMSNKILTPSEKSCIKDYYQKNKAYNEALLQAIGKTKVSSEFDLLRK